MKKLMLLLLIVVFMYPQPQAVDVGGFTQYGVLTVDGGTSHRVISAGGDIVLATIGDGVYLKERFAKFHTRGTNFQGEYLLTMLEARIWTSLWDLYGVGKKGYFFQDKDGDDFMYPVFGVALGVYPVKDKLQFEVGVNLMPVDEKGDMAHVYALLNINFKK